MIKNIQTRKRLKTYQRPTIEQLKTHKRGSEEGERERERVRERERERMRERCGEKNKRERYLSLVEVTKQLRNPSTRMRDP
jgi:hypothetical protein